MISTTDLSEELELEELCFLASFSSSEFEKAIEVDLAKVELLDGDDLNVAPDFGVALFDVGAFENGVRLLVEGEEASGVLAEFELEPDKDIKANDIGVFLLV